MSKKYLVWKNADCNGHNIEWIELSKDEFLSLIRDPKNSGRCFIKLFGEKSDETIVVEVTQKQYMEWKGEINNEYYLKRMRQNSGFRDCSLESLLEDSEEETIVDIFPDETEILEDFVEKSILIQKLRLAIKELPTDERKLIEMLYFSEQKTLSEVEVSRLLGVSQAAINKKKKKILKKLKNLVINFEKSQQ